MITKVLQTTLPSHLKRWLTNYLQEKQTCVEFRATKSKYIIYPPEDIDLISKEDNFTTLVSGKQHRFHVQHNKPVSPIYKQLDKAASSITLSLKVVSHPILALDQIISTSKIDLLVSTSSGVRDPKPHAYMRPTISYSVHHHHCFLLPLLRCSFCYLSSLESGETLAQH